MIEFEHDTFISPFTWRYGSAEMRHIWSEQNKRLIMRQIWVALATAQQQFGLVSAEQVADLQSQQANIDIARALEIEAETRHDVMAEIRTFAEQCPVGGGVIHLGATSADINSNTDAIRIKQAVDILLEQLGQLLTVFADKIDTWAEFPSMAFTHIQPAEPTTIGYRLAQYGQDLAEDYDNLLRLKATVRGKGFKGAVGTSASYAALVGVENTQALEQAVLSQLNLPAYTATTQVYPRKQDYTVLTTLASMGASLHRFTFDLRLLQSPVFGEWREPFGKKQVGSSAMPFKRNPISAEKTGSLARYLGSLPNVAWQNAAGSILERTLDDSANRRLILPDAFLTANEMIRTTQKIVDGLTIDERAVNKNMDTYGPFAATERVLMEAVKAGGDRQILHEVIRECSLKAWEEMAATGQNKLTDHLLAEEAITGLLSAESVHTLMDATDHIGDAPQRARLVASSIRATLESAT